MSEWCQRTNEWMSEWPSTSVCTIVLDHSVGGNENGSGQLEEWEHERIRAYRFVQNNIEKKSLMNTKYFSSVLMRLFSQEYLFYEHRNG